MPSPTDTVMAFLAELEKPGGFPGGIRKFFTPTTNYLNVGMSDTTGIDDTVSFVEGFMTSTGTNRMEVDMLALAETGHMVLTERIDHLIDAQGKLVMSLSVMGIFEVVNGKIVAWRDYFDTAGMAAAGPG